MNASPLVTLKVSTQRGMSWVALPLAIISNINVMFLVVSRLTHEHGISLAWWLLPAMAILLVVGILTIGIIDIKRGWWRDEQLRHPVFKELMK